MKHLPCHFGPRRTVLDLRGDGVRCTASDGKGTQPSSFEPSELFLSSVLLHRCHELTYSSLANSDRLYLWVLLCQSLCQNLVGIAGAILTQTHTHTQTWTVRQTPTMAARPHSPTVAGSTNTISPEKEQPTFHLRQSGSFASGAMKMHYFTCNANALSTTIPRPSRP